MLTLDTSSSSARKRLTVAIGAFVLAGLAGVHWLLGHIVIGWRPSEDVQVELRGAIPFRAAIDQRVDVAIDQKMEARTTLGAFSIDVNENVDIPLHVALHVPIDSVVRVDQPIDVAVDVPIDVVLTEKELNLTELAIPIDQQIVIDEQIPVDFVLPVDTTVTTSLGLEVPVHAKVPVKLKIPIKQPLHVRDVFKPKIRNVRVPLKMVVPVRVRVPLNHPLRVQGTIVAPIDETIRIPLRKTIRPSMSPDVPITVELSGNFPAAVKGDIRSAVIIDQKTPARLGPVRIEGKDVDAHFGR